MMTSHEHRRRHSRSPGTPIHGPFVSRRATRRRVDIAAGRSGTNAVEAGSAAPAASEAGGKGNERSPGGNGLAHPPVHGVRPRRGAGSSSGRADGQTGEAGCVLRRQEPDHRLRTVQRGQLRHSPHRRGHPVQGPQPDPPSATWLELLSGRTQRDARRAARLPTGRRTPVVSRHCRCRHPEHRHLSRATG